MSSSPKKNWPARSLSRVTSWSWIVNLFTPERTTFLAISTPKGPNPLRNTLAVAYFYTASRPMAPIYLLHLSLTDSSVISNSLFYWFLSSLKSTSSKLAIPSLISNCLVFLVIFTFCRSLLPSRSLALGGYNLFNSISSCFMASTNISLYLVFDDLNSVHQLLLWSLIRPVYDASLYSAILTQELHSSKISSFFK